MQQEFKGEKKRNIEVTIQLHVFNCNLSTFTELYRVSADAQNTDVH